DQTLQKMFETQQYFAKLDEVLHENHALAFNTLLSSQETDAYSQTTGGAHFVTASLADRDNPCQIARSVGRPALEQPS
ncbi:hypothetical protein, partial [Nonomuraea sediminis]|uniref:hypothetical protein n=1 Tax=Nonomuraea sediminis TaxID=2835864 RepID=UPI001BDDC7B0